MPRGNITKVYIPTTSKCYRENIRISQVFFQLSKGKWINGCLSIKTILHYFNPFVIEWYTVIRVNFKTTCSRQLRKKSSEESCKLVNECSISASDWKWWSFDHARRANSAITSYLRFHICTLFDLITSPSLTEHAYIRLYYQRLQTETINTVLWVRCTYM